MPNVLMGQRVKELVRRYFMEGLKSSNKLYAGDKEGRDVPDTDKARKREKHQDDAAYTLYQIQQNYVAGGKPGAANFARELLDLEASVRSGNCGEMSIVAAYLANNHEHVAADHIYLGRLSPPGQHVFCLISDAAIAPANQEKATLLGFCETEPNHLIIDPWLNTACLAGAYIRETAARLAKWHGEGKRVSWGGPDGKSNGWYPPSGEYMQAMQRSGVTLIPYD